MDCKELSYKAQVLINEAIIATSTC